MHDETGYNGDGPSLDAGGRKRRVPVFVWCALIAAALVFAWWLGGRSAPGGDEDPIGTSPPPPSAAASASRGLDQMCVVIDPGHGGVDNPGCAFDGAVEKDMNLALAMLLEELLEERGCRVILTRRVDTDIGLTDRPQIANDAGADIFVSIHHNAVENDAVTEGIETWYNDEKNPFSAELAACVQSSLTALTGARDRGVRVSNNLSVLQSPAMPACLAEVGFLSATAERALLISPDYQEKLAQGIVDGIEAFARR